MPIIRPIIGAANYYTAGKLTKYLKKQNISYNRVVDENAIKISFTKKNNNYEYEFNPMTALITSKLRKGPDGSYETNWKEGLITFSMRQADKVVHITKKVSQHTQGFWHRLFHSKRQPYTFTEIEKTVSSPTNKTGYTKKIFHFPNTGITVTDKIPHRSYIINYPKKLNIKFVNVTNDAVEKSIDFQMRRVNNI